MVYIFFLLLSLILLRFSQLTISLFFSLLLTKSTSFSQHVKTVSQPVGSNGESMEFPAEWLIAQANRGRVCVGVGWSKCVCVYVCCREGCSVYMCVYVCVYAPTCLCNLGVCVSHVFSFLLNTWWSSLPAVWKVIWRWKSNIHKPMPSQTHSYPTWSQYVFFLDSSLLNASYITLIIFWFSLL